MRELKRRELLPVLLCCAALVLFGAACGASSQTKESDTEGATNAKVKRGVKPEPDAEAAVLDTEFGRIVIELYPNIAPKMVERFKQLAREGFYNGTAFHRVNPRTGVVQGGDPNSKDDDPTNDGRGDSPYPDVEAEFSDIPFDTGIVGAARQGPRPAVGGLPPVSEEEAFNTANCQFYITTQRVPGWDQQYTVFGRVIDGMSNVSVISNAPVREGTEQPDPKIVIKSITFEPRANFK